eukprot:209954-Amphidinium_carterae.2
MPAVPSLCPKVVGSVMAWLDVVPEVCSGQDRDKECTQIGLYGTAFVVGSLASLIPAIPEDLSWGLLVGSVCGMMKMGTLCLVCTSEAFKNSVLGKFAHWLPKVLSKSTAHEQGTYCKAPGLSEPLLAAANEG